MLVFSQMEPRKVVWAVDAFDPPDRLKSQVPAVLKALEASGKAAEVQPIYVLTPKQLNLSPEVGGPWIHEYRPAAERALQGMFQKLNIPGLRKPEVIVEHLTSVSQGAKTLAAHAFAMNADLIVVNTHGRRGVRRFFLGSFAESLLYHSKIPVMILRPKIRISNAIRTILFPSEFGPHSKRVFREVVSIARGLGARMILFHAIPHPIEPILQSGAYLMGGSWVPIQSYFSAESDRRIRRAEAWARWAHNQGVDVEPTLDTQGGSVSDSIVYLARSRKADLIAMQSQTGPMLSTILGSVTRYVIRHADCPVWVIHSKTGLKSGEAFEAPRRAA